MYKASLFVRLVFALALGAATALIVDGEAQAQTQAAAVAPVQDFSVFVDLPTGFAFVKTPGGWHFVRAIPPEQLSQLHPSTLVSVVQAGMTFSEVERIIASAAP